MYFLDGVHFLHNAIAGYGWIKCGTQVEIKTNSGRNRFNVLGAYSPDSGHLVSVEGTETCDAEMVKKLLVKIRQTHPGGSRLIVILDNVPYQHVAGVKQLAQELKIELLYLPPYSPNLNLIERLWKFMKKKVARNKYYPTFEEFVTAVQQFLRDLDVYAEELKSLMRENFHLFKATG